MAKFVLTAEIVLQAPKNVNQVVNNIQSQLNNIQANVTVQGATAANKQIQQLTKSTNQASSAAEKMGKSFTASVRRFSALAIATRAVSLFTNTLGGAIKESIAFERELVKISQVTGKTIAGLSKLTNTVSDLSTGLGVSSTSLLSVSRILAQTGLSAKDTQTALGTLARTELAPTFDSISQTAEGAVAILNQFGQGAGALEAQLGSLNAVAGQFAVEAGDLVAAIRRTGGVFKSAGGDLNELIALFTSVRATTRESAESIATGLRTIFTRIQRPETIDYLRQFGVELTDIEGKFVGPYEATRRLSEALAGLGERDLRFVEIAEQLGGFRQIGKVLPLLQQFTVAQNALKAAQEGTGSLATDAAKAQAALAVQITKVKEEFLELVRNFTSSTSFQVMADTVLALASAMIKLADALSPVLPLLTAFAGIKFAGAAFGAIGGIGKSLGFNDGGKVEHFARGGMVPGTGSGDTVPAMLTPGEFVIKKSSVQKLGAANLEEMNNGGGVAKYNRGTKSQGAEAYDIKVKDGAVGGFFLNPGKGQDRSFPINVRNAGNLTNPNVLAQLAAKNTAASASTDELLNSLNPTARARVFGFKKIKSNDARSDQLKKTDFNSGSPVKQPGGKGDITFKDLGPEGEKRLREESNIASSTTNARSIKIDKITGKGAGYLPGKDMEQNAEVSGAIARAAGDILKSGVEQAAQEIKSLASFGGTINPPIRKETGADRLAADPNAKSSIEGFLYEGVIDSLTGAMLAGNQAAFDFPYSSINSNRKSLQAFFSPTKSLDTLLNADAKRSFALAPTIGPKVLGDMNVGNTKGYEIFKGSEKVLQFAKGGAARGEDTIPAMLTPGEFVVNKKSAKSIGYGNLHRMNKVGKYAKGGVVHKFGNGTGSGGVPSGGGAGIDISGLQAALGGLATSIQEVMAELQAYANASTATAQSTTDLGDASDDVIDPIKKRGDVEKTGAENSMSLFVAMGIATTAVNMLTPEIDETSGAFDYLANSLAQTAMQMITLAGLMSQLGGFQLVAKSLDNITAVATDVKGSMRTLGKSISSGWKSLTSLGTTAQAAATANAVNSTANSANTVATGSNTAAANTSGVALVYNAAMAMLSAGGLATLAAVVLGVVAIFVVLAAGIGIFTSAMAGYAKALKEKAIEDGDVEAAGEAASDQYGWEEASGSLWRMATGVGIVTETLAILNGDYDKARKAVMTAARAEAALAKSAEEVTKAEEDAASAFKEFEAGTRSIGSVLAATAESGKAVIQSQREVAAANMAAQKAVVTWSSSLGTALKYLTSWFGGGTSFGFSTIEGNQEKADAEIEARNSEQEKREVSYIAANTPATNALMKQVAAAGGSIEDFYTRLEVQNESLYKLIQGTEATEKAFANIAAEAERTRDAFEAMNLGFQSVQASAGALQVSVDNLLRGMDSGASELESTLATLQAGITNAAQGMSDGDWNKAMGEATAALESLGASKEQVDKFKGNLDGINAAQKFYANAVKETKDKLRADFERGVGGQGTSEDRKAALKNAIVNQIPDDIGPDVKDRILKGLNGLEIDEKDMQRLMEGDFDVIDKLLGELGEDTLKQVMNSFESLINVDKERLKIVKKLVKLEEALIAARSKSLDVEIEARGLEEKYGGRKFSAEEQKALIFDKGNLRKDIPKLQTGSKQEFDDRNAAMLKQAREIGETRKRAAGGDSEAKAEIRTQEFQNKEASVNSFVKEELALKRELLKVIDGEIKAIKAKEAAEKKAADALLGNDLEAAAEEMAAQGAVAAAALGDPNLMSGFSRTDYGRGSKSLDEMKKAGVKDLYGKDIDELNVATRTEGLSRMMSRPDAERMAKQGVGESDEIKDKNAEGLAIAQTMVKTQEIMETVIKDEIDVQEKLIDKLEDLRIAIVNNTNSRNGGAEDGEESETKDSKDEKKDGTKGAGGAGGAGGADGGPAGGMKSSSTSSRSHSDCCCDGVSKVKVVNPGDFDTEAQMADTNSKSLAGIVAENPVMISVAKRAIDSKPLVKAVKNALVPVGKVVKNAAKSTFQAAKKVMPKGRPKPVSSLDLIGPKPADAADAAKAAAATKTASKKPPTPPVERPLPPPPRSVKAAQEQVIGSRGPQNPALPPEPMSPDDLKALDSAKARQATSRTKLQQVDNLDVNKLPPQVKKVVDRVRPNKGKDTAKLVEEILSEVRPGADGLTDITRKADMGILSKGNQNIDLDKLMKKAMEKMNWDADKLYNNLISAWGGDMTPSFNSLETSRMTGFKESRLPEMQAEFTKNTGIDPKGMGSAYDEYADATKKVSDLQAAAPTPKAATQAVPPPLPAKGAVPPPLPAKGAVPPPLPVQEQSTASKVLDSVTGAVKSKVDSGLDAVKGLPEVAKAVKESLKSKIPNVSMPEFKMPDLGISDFGSGLRAKDGIVNPTNPASKAAMDALPEAVGASKAAKAGTGIMKGLKNLMTFLGPVADVADVGVGVYTGIARTEETRGNLSIDKGLDDQNTVYKGLIGGLTGTPTMGGSVTSSLSGLVGGPQAEVGSTTDLALSSGESVLRGASLGATAGIPFGPAGVAVGAAGGAVIGGSAELIKAIGFLQQAVEESTKSAEKAEGLRNASKDETGLDVVVRNLVGANANAKLDLEEAKASGDKDKIASAESNLKNTQQALDNNIQQRREKGGDLRGTVFTSGRPKVDAELKKQQAFSDKVVAANRQARADEAKAAEARAAVIKENKKSASQESTGQFDYRTGLPTQTMFDIPQQEKDPYKAAEDAIAESEKFTDSLPDPKTMVAQMTADRESAEAEKEAQAKEANITTPTVKIEAQNVEDTSLEDERANNLAHTPEQLRERGIESIYTEDDNLDSNSVYQPGDVKSYTEERRKEQQRMAGESMDETLGGDPNLMVDNNRITPSKDFSFSDEINKNFGVAAEAPVSDKIVQPQATVTDSVPTAAIEAPPAPGEQAMKTPASESGAGGGKTIASAMGEMNPERQAKIKQMEEGAAEAAETKKEDLPKKEQEAIAEAMSKEQPTSTDDCCSKTLEILKQILEAVKNIGQYDPSELGSMTVANPEAIAKASEKEREEKSANDKAKADSDMNKATRKGLGIEEGKTLKETKELQEASEVEAEIQQEEYKEPRDNLGLTASQASQLERTDRSETASGKLSRLAGASKAGSKFNQRMQDKEQRVIDQEKYRSAQDLVGEMSEEEKKEVMLGFDTKQENPFLAKGDYDNEKSDQYAQMQQQKRIAYAQKTGGRLRKEDEDFLKFENDRQFASSAQAAEKNKKPPEEQTKTAYASSVEKTMEAGTGKFDINTQQEITNPFLPLIDSIDKDLKVAKEAGDSDKEKALLDEKALTQAASDIYSQINPESKASDDIALSGNFYKDAIVLLKAILDAVSNCCGGASSNKGMTDLFNFTKTFDESMGQGVPQGVPVDSLGYKDVLKTATAEKTLQETETDDRTPSRAALLMQKKPVTDDRTPSRAALLMQKKPMTDDRTPSRASLLLQKKPETDDRTPSRAALLSKPKEEEKELTTGGAFDNGQFSAGNPFRGDVSGGGGMVSNFMKNIEGLMIPSRLPEEASGLGGIERMEGDLLNLTETNTLLTSIETVLQTIVTNTQPANVQNEQNQNEDGGNLLSELSSITNSFQTIFSSFTNDFTNAIARLENVSIEIKVQPLNVTVDLNGGNVLDKLKSYVGDEMIDAIAKEIKTYKVGANNKLTKGQSTLANGGGGGW